MFQTVRFCSGVKEHLSVPRYLSFNPAAIDVSSKTIRLMKLKKRKGNCVPGLYKEISLDEKYDVINISKNKDINSEEAKILIKTLSDLKKEFNLKFVGITLPDVENYIYKIQLPVEAIKEIASAVRFSIEENAPISIDDAVFDYVVLQDPQLFKKGKIDVVVNVFPKNIISIYTEILKQSGLTPISFQSESTALAHSIIKTRDNEPYLIIRLVDNRINVAIVERNVVQYSSSISIDINQVLADQNGEKANELKAALNKVLIFWFTNRNFDEEHKKIKTALIVGENGLSQEIDEFLERHLKINVDTGNVWANCFDINEYVPALNKKDALNFAVSVGLALKLAKHE